MVHQKLGEIEATIESLCGSVPGHHRFHRGRHGITWNVLTDPCQSESVGVATPTMVGVDDVHS